MNSTQRVPYVVAGAAIPMATGSTMCIVQYNGPGGPSQDMGLVCSSISLCLQYNPAYQFQECNSLTETISVVCFAFIRDNARLTTLTRMRVLRLVLLMELECSMIVNRLDWCLEAKDYLFYTQGRAISKDPSTSILGVMQYAILGASLCDSSLSWEGLSVYEFLIQCRAYRQYLTNNNHFYQYSTQGSLL